MTEMPEERQKSWLDTLPFPKRWLVCIAIKFGVLALAVLFALNYYGML